MSDDAISVGDLAAELGVSPSVLTTLGLLAGYRLRGGQVTPAQAGAIRIVHRDRQSRIDLTALAAELGVARVTVANRARALRLPPGQGYTPEQSDRLRASFARKPPRRARGVRPR